jgi:hypothetical protein
MLFLHLNVCHVTPPECSAEVTLPDFPLLTLCSTSAHRIFCNSHSSLYAAMVLHFHICYMLAEHYVAAICARPLTRHSRQCCCSTSTPAMCSQSILMQPPCQIAHHQIHPDTGLSARLSADHPIHRQFNTSDMHLLCLHLAHASKS